jgi:hypothetical protein
MSIRERNCCNEKRQPAPHSVLQIRVPVTLPAHQCHRLAKVLAAHGPRLTGSSFDPNKLPGEVQSQSQAEERALEQAEARELARVRAQPQETFHMSMELYGEVSGSQRLELDVKKWDFSFREVRLFASAGDVTPSVSIQMDPRIAGQFNVLLKNPRRPRRVLRYRLVEMDASEAFEEFFSATIGALDFFD